MAAIIIRFFPRYLRKEAKTSGDVEQHYRQMPGYLAILRYWRKATCKSGRVATRCLHNRQLFSERHIHISSDKGQKPTINGNNRN